MLTPTVGLKFIELQPINARLQHITSKNLFIGQALKLKGDIDLKYISPKYLSHPAGPSVSPADINYWSDFLYGRTSRSALVIRYNG